MNHKRYLSFIKTFKCEIWLYDSTSFGYIVGGNIFFNTHYTQYITYTLTLVTMYSEPAFQN